MEANITVDIECPKCGWGMYNCQDIDSIYCQNPDCEINNIEYERPKINLGWDFFELEKK